MSEGRARRRVLIVLPTDTFGGAERVTYNLIRGMRVFEPVLLTQEVMRAFFSGLGVPILTFDGKGRRAPGSGLRTIVSYAGIIRKTSETVSPAVVFGVMHFASLFALLARDFMFMRVPVVTSIHGTYSSHVGSAGMLTPWERLLVRYLLKRSKLVVVPSEGIREDMVRHLPVEGRSVQVVHNGFDLDLIRRRGGEEVSLTKDRPWIVTASRLGPPKDFRTLLRAFRRIRERTLCRLLIVGEGPYEEEIRGWVRDFGVADDVAVLGFQENPFKYMARADLVVLSSFSEGLPSTLIEAMALGVPVVSTDCPSGPAEIIRDGESGFLVAVGDEASMADRCLAILRDDSLRSRLSVRCLERAEAFSIERMCGSYERIFQAISA